jgi:hypothetical protein
MAFQMPKSYSKACHVVSLRPFWKRNREEDGMIDQPMWLRKAPHILNTY